MNFLIFKKKPKDKYYADYSKANGETLYQLNRYCSIFCIIKVIIDIIFVDPVAFPNLVSQMFHVRMLFILMAFIVLIASLIKPLKKINMIIAIFFNLSVMIFCANILLVTKNDLLHVNTWIIIIVIFVGLYPVPVLTSIIIFLISYFYFLIFSIIHGYFLEAYKQLIFVNILGVAIASSIFKFFIIHSNKNEFYAKKDLENANKEIKDLNEKLQSFDKIKTDFFSNISHEIRTPLTLFKTPIESYFDGKIKIDNINEFLSNLLKNADRLSNLINNLLDFSKLDAGRMNLSLKETDINIFLQNYIYTFKTAGELKNITLELMNLSKNLKIFIDQDKIDKVFMNILSNALKFTDPGGKIRVKLWNDVNHCFVEFTDTGTGIPEKMKNAVFERFRQVDSGLSRGHEGSGIGLALAKEYMVMQGGRITLESKYFKDFPEDHGSKFTLIFLIGKEHFKKMDNVEILYDKSSTDSNEVIKPIIISEIDYHSKETGTSNNYISDLKPNILVVEDNQEMADFIANILKQDYNVLFANNGLKAIEKLNMNKIDLVLSDIMMPEMDGYTMLKSIRQENRFSRLPVILLTAKIDDKMKIGSLENGANDYLTKPFNSRELLARIRTQIHLKLFLEKLIDKIDEKNKDKIDISASVKKKLEYTIDFLNNNFLDIISRENLAITLGISPDYFSRLFKQYTGKKVQEYLNELRIKYAANMLTSSNKKIIDIAMESGFETLRTFNRDFIKQMNISPSEYRLKIITKIKNERKGA